LDVFECLLLDWKSSEEIVGSKFAEDFLACDELFKRNGLAQFFFILGCGKSILSFGEDE